MTVPELPFVDRNTTTLPVDQTRAWQAVERFARRLTSDSPLLARLLACEPGSGFGVDSTDPPDRLVVAGRHRFSRYRIEFVLEPAGPDATHVHADSYAAFPGLPGRAYRAAVIGTGLHKRLTCRWVLGGIRSSTPAG